MFIFLNVSSSKVKKKSARQCKFLNQKIVVEKFYSFTLSMDNLFIGF